MPQSRVLSAVELEAEPLISAGISLQRELVLWDESQTELSWYTHSQQKSSEELQVTGASCQK